MKVILIIALLLNFSFAVIAQDTEQLKLHQFDPDKYNSWNFENNFENLEFPFLLLDTMSFTQKTEEGEIGVYTPKGNMAPMPNMEIRKDVKYTMQIKGYDNKYPYEPSDTVSLKKLEFSQSYQRYLKEKKDKK